MCVQLINFKISVICAFKLFIAIYKITLKGVNKNFPGGLVVKNPPANSGDAGSVTGLGRSPGEGNCLGNPMDRGDRCATVHGVAEGWNST